LAASDKVIQPDKEINYICLIPLVKHGIPNMMKSTENKEQKPIEDKPLNWTHKILLLLLPLFVTMLLKVFFYYNKSPFDAYFIPIAFGAQYTAYRSMKKKNQPNRADELLQWSGYSLVLLFVLATAYLYFTH
jgi:polyferredoxin